MHIARPRLALLAVLLLPAGAHAQDAALDDRLRDLLRQTTVQLRAAQDSTATLQASLDSMTKQRDLLQQKLDATPPVPPTPAVDPQRQAALQQAQAGLAAARAEAAQAAAQAQRFEQQYQHASVLAGEKDASDQRNQAGLKRANARLAACSAANTRLIALAGDILHLYETPKFNALLTASHERLIGFKRVELENLVQDYDDRIQAQIYIDPAPAPATP